MIEILSGLFRAPILRDYVPNRAGFFTVPRGGGRAEKLHLRVFEKFVGPEDADDMQQVGFVVIAVDLRRGNQIRQF
jgi:hypothetical protein